MAASHLATPPASHRWPSRIARRLAACLLAAAAGLAQAAIADDARRLRERHDELASAFAASPFHAPLVVQSGNAGSMAHGDVYALLPHGFPLVDSALDRPAQWCDVLMLHLNVKACHWSADSVTIFLGSKRSAAPADAYELALAFRAENDAADYLRVRLDAPRGPVGTRDYVLLFEAVPAAAGETFVHFGYEVRTGFLAELAMRGYLLTAGRGKIGFSQEPGPDGAPRAVSGTRGVMERNAMRYHLAIVAYLDSLGLPEAQRPEARLEAWFEATERYPAQLHELDRGAYLEMKRAELKN